MADGWPCWAISNHDVERAVTRWGGAEASEDFGKQLIALVCSLRGSVCLYQGEELGLGEADVPYEALQDPYGKTFWPNFKGRDGCRTPMPWSDSLQAGFTEGKPWLPIADAHRARSVAIQDPAPDSTLNATRRFLHWRKTMPALETGDIGFISTPEPILAFERSVEGARVLVVFNLSDIAVQWQLPDGVRPTRLDGHGLVSGEMADGVLALPAHGVFYARLE